MESSKEKIKQMAREMLPEAESDVLRLRAEMAEAESYVAHLRGLATGSHKLVRQNEPDSEKREEVQRPTKFRDVIRTAINEASAPLSVSDVVERLKEAGFSEDGSTALQTRVGNELYKLAVQGEITRASRGHYESTKH